MRISKPSPAMLVACLALFIALGGTSIAAVNYARNAGKVDGKDAVAASSSLAKAAGDVVATNRTGPDKGKIPAKFLADVPVTRSFATLIEVNDNQASAPVTLATFEGFGDLSGSCSDQSNAAGVEDPRFQVAVANRTTAAINGSRRLGGGNGEVAPIPPGALYALTSNGSNTFEYQLQAPNGTNLLIQGAVRQDGRGSSRATCLIYGTVLRVTA